MTEHLGAERYAHNDNRQGYRNGYRERKLTTRVGPLILRVPQTRDGSFNTEVFKRYQRSERTELSEALSKTITHDKFG